MNPGSQNPEHSLDKEIAAYNAMKAQLEQAYLGKWVIFYECQFKGSFDDFDAAAQEAIKQFGRGPYLIRQVGEQPLVLPASVVYSALRHAD